MEIELKNVKIIDIFSEETTCFKADVFVNGIKTAYASNHGHGGCTNYSLYPGKEKLLKEAEKYCLSLPSIKWKTIEIKMNLERFIDELVCKYPKIN